MKLTLEEIVALKHICIKAQNFDMAAKFREEEKKILKRLPKYKIHELKQRVSPKGQWLQIGDNPANFGFMMHPKSNLP